MASQIKLRRGTAAQWTSTNPTLAEGEAGFEVDTNKLKVGDGTTAWNSLEYLTSSASVDFSEYITISSASTTYLTQNSASTTYATKEELENIDLSSASTTYLTQASASITYAPVIPTTQTGFRNLIINGDFRINQRVYASESNLASGSYGFDRWKSTFTNTTLTFSSAPQGQELTINSGGSIEQIIERANIPAGTYVLSWTGTATGRVYNTGATPPSYTTSPVIVTLDGTANVEVEFTASGGTKTLQNVQIEQGSSATPFEKRPIGTELILCQRYYQRLNAYASTSYDNILAGFAISSNSSVHVWNLPVQMRAVPTSSISYSTISVINPAGGTLSDSITLSNNNDNSLNHVYINASSATSPWTANLPLYISLKNPTSFLAVSAEL